MKQFRFNYFLSHAKKDRDLAKRLKSDLEERGKRCWIDEDLLAGDHIPSNVEEGLAESKRLICLLSASSVESGWVLAEAWSKLHECPLNKARVIIPIQIEDCVIPPILATLKRIDGRNGITDAVVRSVLRASI